MIPCLLPKSDTEGLHRSKLAERESPISYKKEVDDENENSDSMPSSKE
jgi:hypothetical protein